MDKINLFKMISHINRTIKLVADNQPGLSVDHMRLWLHAEFDYLYELGAVEDFKDVSVDGGIEFSFRPVNACADLFIQINYVPNEKISIGNVSTKSDEIKTALSEMPENLALTLGY